MNVSNANTAAKSTLGLGAFNDKSLSRPELIYVLSSKNVGYDLKAVYELYGLPVTAKTHASIAMLNLPTAPLRFYAQPEGGSNRLQLGNG